MTRHEVTRHRRFDGSLVFECASPGCERLLVLDRGRMTVLRKGDPQALHGSGIGLQASIG